MATAESRPYRTPSTSSVQTKLVVVDPEAAVDRVRDVWTPGDDVRMRGTAVLSDDFWVETGIRSEEGVSLVIVATCAPARITWRQQARFETVDGVWSAEVEVIAGGSELAVALTVDLWIVGAGRTGSPNPAHEVHHSAKLWQLPAPLRVDLEREDSDFPTSAISFSAAGRRSVPWLVEIVPDAEPHWSISSAVRLLVNTDLDVCDQIVSGSAGGDLYSVIEGDIHLAVLHSLAGWRDTIRGNELLALAEDDYRCLAALGLSIATSLGLTIDEGCRLAWEDPLALATRSREALRSYQVRGAN